MLGRFGGNRSGATAIEYALMAALIAVAAIAGMQMTGTSVNDLYNSNEQQVTDVIQ